MRKHRFTEEQILLALRQDEVGTLLVDICRRMGIINQPFVPM